MFSSRAPNSPNRSKQEPRESNFFATEDNMAAINGGSPMEIDSRNENEVDRLIISTDFGTTFSCVAFASTKKDIGIVRGYATDPMSIQKKPRFDVPTESWYPTKAKLEELMIERNADIDEPMLRFDDEDDSDDDFNDAQGKSGLQPNFMYWGYEVQDKLSEPDLDKKQYNCITRSKLLLDTSYETKKIREELKPVLKTLKARKYIKADEDVIAQYLEQLFSHAKRYLKDIRRLKATTVVEHVLCVPVIWSPSACRKMQSAMEIAIQQTELGSINNLFLVSEPEAAAAYVLEYSKSISVSKNAPLKVLRLTV